MPAASPSTPVRPRSWSLRVLLAVLVVVALWLLEGRQPAPWPDAESAWSLHVDALAPASWAIDRLNALAPLSPELPAASVAVLVLLALATLGTLSTLDLPAAITVAVALSVVFLRSAWSTAAPGLDARPLLVASLATLSVVRPDIRWLPALTSVGVLGLAPSAVWLVVPAFLGGAGTLRRRVVASTALVAAALALRAWHLHAIWNGLACLPTGQARSVIMDVLRPGVLVDLSPWWSLQTTLQVLQGDLHAFGLALASAGLLVARGPGRLRVATGIALVLAPMASVMGLLPPAHAAALLLPWTLPWLALGLHTLTGRTSHATGLSTACAALAIIAVPVLRHAVVSPAPWHPGSPAITRAVAADWDGGGVATDDPALMRRLRVLGVPTVPAEPVALAACVASGRPVFALGPTISYVEGLGFRLSDSPLRAPLGAVLTDVRRGTFLALGLTPGTLPFAGPQGLRALEAVGLPRTGLGARDAAVLIGQAGEGVETRHASGAVDLSVPAGSRRAGAPQLLAAWSVTAGADAVDIASAPTHLVSSRHAALVVLDKAQDVALRTAAAPQPGLPVALGSHPTWRRARVLGERTCRTATVGWEALTPSQRLSMPVAGASEAVPAVVWAVSNEVPDVSVRGLPVHPTRPLWEATVFDRQAGADEPRLMSRLRADGFPAPSLPEGRFVARISIAPPSRLARGHAAVGLGVMPVGWVVRLGTQATRPEYAAACAMADGERMLGGQAGLVDDDTAREVPVATRDGWHPPEAMRNRSFQWTARASASATFRLEAPADLDLSLDATGADVGAGAQPITVRVNGRVVREDWQGADRVALPAASLVPGQNVITLSVARVATPPGDTRTLGMLVRQFRLIARRR